MIKTSYVLVTPETAAEMLKHNTGNRILRPAAIATMAAQMRAGQWTTTHQGIAFDADGNLLDGQHRLHAIVKAGAPILLAVSRGVPSAAFKVMDGASGSAGLRNLRDVTGADRRILEPCSLMVRLDRGTPQKVTYDDVAPYLHGPLGNAVAVIVGAYGANSAYRCAAPIKLGASLRSIADKTGYVVEQWRALGSLDYDAMSPIIKAFCRMITNRKTAGSSAQRDLACVSWLAFDPSRRHLKRFPTQQAADALAELVAFGRKQSQSAGKSR